MKSFIVAAALATAVLSPVLAYAQAAPATTEASKSSYYSVADSTIGDLLANPATKAVLEKYIPDIVNNPQIDMASAMTLTGVQQYAPDQLTDEVLAKIDADLTAVPAPAK